MEPLLLPCKPNIKTFVRRSAFTVHCNTGHVQLTTDSVTGRPAGGYLYLCC